MAWSFEMAKSFRPESKEDAPRRGHARACGDLVGEIAGTSFKRFGFIQGAVVSRWPEIVGDRYAKVSTPESIRFPAGKKSGGTLTLTVEGAHAPLMQHLGPLIIERVNRFFGYEAVSKLAFRQGRLSKAQPAPKRPVAPIRNFGPALNRLHPNLPVLAVRPKSTIYQPPRFPSFGANDPHANHLLVSCLRGAARDCLQR
jgi:hypothetical protein